MNASFRMRGSLVTGFGFVGVEILGRENELSRRRRPSYERSINVSRVQEGDEPNHVHYFQDRQ